MSVLEVKAVGKSYRKFSSELKRVLSWFNLPFKPIEEHWVLQNISFNVQAGEALGLVGQNGAGKSTLLKMITGVTQSTTGSITTHGKIAAILELGMGFNPEFTGRRNATHGLSMMGYSQAEIEAVMPELEAFADIGAYFDEPVRTYSSGMQMRVAFAVATAFQPDILIIDEALSVGDSYFQHKSFDRILTFKKQGTSLLFVSHDKASILALCDRAILLEQGNIIQDAEPEQVMDFYNALIADKENNHIEQSTLDSGRIQTRSGTGEAKVEQVILYNSKGEQAEHISVGEAVELRVNIKVYQDIPCLVLGYSIKDRLGQTIFGTNTWYSQQQIAHAKQGESYTISVSFNADFGVGNYSIQTALVDHESHLSANYDWLDLALVFNVINTNKTPFTGLLWQEPSLDIQKND